MKCPEPSCPGHGIKGDHSPLGERAVAANAGLKRALHPSNPQQAAGQLAFTLAGMAAKMALSSTYKCTTCGHVWRKWFTWKIA